MPAPEEKPYKVYRGGRTKGKVPLSRTQRSGREQARQRSGRDGTGSAREVVRRPRKRWTWRRWLPLALTGVILVLVLWGVAGYFSVKSGVSAANGRLPEGTAAALKPQNGL